MPRPTISPWGQQITERIPQTAAQAAIEDWSAECLMAIEKARHAPCTNARREYLIKQDDFYRRLWWSGVQYHDTIDGLGPDFKAFCTKIAAGKLPVPKELSPESTYEGNPVAAAAAVAALAAETDEDRLYDAALAKAKTKSNTELFEMFKVGNAIERAAAVVVRTGRTNGASTDAEILSVWLAVEKPLSPTESQPAQLGGTMPSPNTATSQPPVRTGTNLGSAVPTPAEARAMADREWDSDPGVRQGFRSKNNFVNVRAAELTGRLSVSKPRSQVVSEPRGGAAPQRPRTRNQAELKAWAEGVADQELKQNGIPDGFSSAATWKLYRVAVLTGRHQE